MKNKIKIATDLEQSQKLAKILPIESADMYYMNGTKHVLVIPNYETDFFNLQEDDIPCWSLAALLNVLELPTLEEGNIGKNKTGWMVSVYPDNCRYNSTWHDNAVDACYEMILKLHELKKL